MSFRCRSVTWLVAGGALVGSLVSCAEPSGNQQLWVADYYVQCNEFDEPFRECLLVSESEFGLYRHIEGSIEGFDFEPGTKYLLEVERVTDGDTGSWRLVEVLESR